MAGPLPPGFTFDDETAPAAPSSSVLPPGFRFDDEPAPPADVPLPPRRPADLAAQPQPADVPLPPARPAELPVGNDYSGTDWPAASAAPANTGGILDGILGNTGKLTPEQGKAEQEAKAARTLAELQAAKENAARTAAAPPPLPAFSDGPPAQESEAQVANAMKGASFDAAANAAVAPPPTLTPGRAGVQTGINAAAKGAVGIAKPIGQLNADLGAPQFKDAIAGAERGIDQAFPQDPGRAGEASQTFAQAAGGLAPFIAGGSIAKGLGVSVGGVTAAIGALQGGGAGYEAAEAAGAGPMARYLAMFGQAGIGAAQAVPFMRMLDRVEQMAPGAITNILKSGAQTSLEQAAVQGLSKLGENGIAKLVYDKDQGLLDGIVESAQVGALVGGALGIGGAFAANPNSRAALAERLRTSTPEEIDAFIGEHSGKSTRAEIDEFLRQKEAADAAKEAPSPPAAEAPGDRRGESSPGVSPPDNGATAQPIEPPPTNPTQDSRQAEDAILRAMHYDDEDIADMSPGERAKRLKEAQQAGVTPEGAQKATPAADEAPGTDSAPAESGTQEPKLPPGFTFDDEPAAPVDIKVNNPAPEPSPPGESASAPSAPSAPRQPQTLLSFIKAAGGIKDVDGNLRAAGLHRYPGLINNKSGMDPDRAREAAAEGGYLGADRDHAHSNTTPDDLLNELQKHPTYSSFDEEQLVQWRAHTGGKAQREKDLSKAESDIHADQLDAGAPKHLIDDHYVREGARLHVDEGVPLQDAYEQAVMRDVREHIGDDTAKKLDAEIPWDNYETPKNDAEGADAKGAEGGHATPAPGESTEVGGAPRSGGQDGNGREESPVAPARTGSPRDRNEERPLEEAGAEGKPQLVIPGAEQISQEDLGKKKVKEQAAADLKPTVPQKDTDGLALFNDSSKQTDLLDQPAKKPEEKPAIPAGFHLGTPEKVKDGVHKGRFSVLVKREAPWSVDKVHGDTPEEATAAGHEWIKKNTLAEKPEEKPESPHAATARTIADEFGMEEGKHEAHSFFLGKDEPDGSRSWLKVRGTSKGVFVTAHKGHMEGRVKSGVGRNSGPFTDIADLRKEVQEGIARLGLKPEEKPEPKRDTEPLRVAWKMPDGSVRIGKPGQIHADLLGPNEIANPEAEAHKGTPGFVTGNDTFLDREQAVQHLKDNAPEQLPKKIDDRVGLEAAHYNQRNKLKQPKPEPKGKPLDDVIADYDAKIDELLDNIAGQKTPSPFDPSKGVPDAVADHLYRGNGFPTIMAARKFVKEHGGEKLSQKAQEEAIEHGVVKAARAIVAEGKTPEDTYNSLVALYANQPRLSTRTSTSVEQQAYSTPAPLAYVASQLAHITPETTVLEPTAGNGMLLIGADPKKAVANEINPERRATLAEQGFRIGEHDASQVGILNKQNIGNHVDSVIANPPFGVVKEDGKSKRFNLEDQQPGYSTNEIDHAIALRSLKAMRDNGHAVLILGGINKLVKGEEKRSDAYHGKAKREFFHVLYKNYNVTDHFTVAGELYEKQGAGWPVDVITIHGRGKSNRKVPSVEVPPVLRSWDELKDKLNAAGRDRSPGPEDNRAPDVPVAEAGLSGSPVLDEQHREDAGRGEPPTVNPAEGRPGKVRAGRGGEQLGAGSLPGSAGRPQVPPGELPHADRPDGVAPTGRGPGLSSTPIRQTTETEGQAAYKPKSKTEGLGTLVPRNMRRATEQALEKVAKSKGSIDKYVADAIGMKEGDLAKHFGAEQVDALGLAIYNMERGSGFIIGDQTGIGKGRVNAAIIRYAIHNHLTPIFVTEKPGLYADMYRDLKATGIIDYLGRQPKILMTNADEHVPFEDNDGIKTPGGKEHNPELLKVAEAGQLTDHDMLFTTYNQMQTVKGATTARQAVLRALAPKAVVIFDESHNAGGTETKAEGPQPKGLARSDFARELVQKATSVFYSSATYAKRPSVMSLYSKTDMVKAVDKPEDLAPAMASGGVPMQQVVASMLAEAGQYVRRERSFSGITYDPKTVPVDRAKYEAFSGSIAAIHRFSESAKDAIKNIDKDIKAEAQSISHDGSTGGDGAQSTNFTAIMHNLVSQFLLAQKAPLAVHEAIESLKRGEKPVLTVANTMESFLKEYVEDHDLSPGDPINLSFHDLLTRYLERTRTITIKRPFSKEPGKKHYLKDSELGPAGVARYRAAQVIIGNSDVGDLPLSPIDHIRDELTRAGYKIGEVTGRKSGISYADPKTPRYYTRPTKETSTKGKNKTIKGFNDGELDGLVLNQSGATGLSAHASVDFKDQRQRHMVIVQPEANVDTFMQMLGRINRTGQVVLPKYTQLSADIPAELRYSAILTKKMASLNASTTADRKGALSADTIDIMNQYGDKVAYDMMRDNPQINAALGQPIKLDETVAEGAMRKLTGRIPLLKVKHQEELYDDLTEGVKTLIAEREAAGENVLEAKRLELDAKLVSRLTVREGSGDNPFTQPVNLEILDVKRQSKPYFAKDLLRDSAENLSLKGKPDLEAIEAAGKAANKLQVQAALDAFKPFAKEMLAEIENEATLANTQARLDDNENRFRQVMDVARVGRQVSVVSDDQRHTGIITKVYRDGKAQNPLALGTWKVKIAIPGKAQVAFPFSKLYTSAKPSSGDEDDSYYRIEASLPDSNVLKNFDEMSKDARENRAMLTGNLLAAYAWKKGQIVHYTDHEGAVRQGVLLSSEIASAEDAMHGKGTPLATGREVLDLVEKTGQPLASSTDSNVSIKKSGGALTISIPSARAKGGDYFLDKQLREIGQGDFIRRGSTMQIDVPRWGDQAGAIDRLMQLGAKFEKPYEKTEKSASVAHMQRLHLAENHGGRLPEDVAKVVRDALDAAGIARAVAGKHADVDITERLIPISKSVAQKSGSDKASLAFGLFSSNKSLGQRLVQIAFATGVEKRTAYHEAFHALESADVFHDAEKNVLKRETPRLRQIVQKDLKISDDELHGMPDYEIRAYAFEKWAHDTDKGDKPNTGHGLHLGIRRIFEKVKDFLRRLKNKLQGAGFQTTEDVFARARSGEMGQREAGPNAYNIRSNLGSEPGTFTAAAIPHNGRHFNREPAIDRIKRKIANAVDPANAEESLLDLSARLRRMQVELAAGGHPVRPSTDAYMAKRLMPGIIEARKDDFDREYVKPLAAQMKAAGLTLQDLDEYVASEHIPERNARMDQVDPNNNGRGSGFSDADAQAIRARLSAEGKIPALISAAHYVAGMREFELKTLEDAGLISQDQADALRGMYQHYVPFKGWEDPDNIPEGAIWGTGPGARMSVKGPEYHHAFGRTTSSDSPVANLINQTYRAITRAERNDSVNTLYRLLKSLPKATRDTIAILDKGPKMKVLDESTGQMRWVTEPNWYKGEDVVSLKIAGNMHRIRFHDEALAQGINRLHPDQLPNWLRPVGAFINLEKSLWTHWNPDFVLRHFFMRYPTETFLNAREHGLSAMFATLKGYPGGSAFRAILAADKMTSAERATLAHKVASGNASEAEEWQHLYHRYRDAGGLMRFSDIAGVERIKKKLDSALARLDRNPLHAALAGARAGYDAIDHMTNVLDNANRLAVFVHAVKNGATDKEAAFRAREASVDFALKGTAQKIINIWWPFGNTAAQTASRSVRGIKRSSAYRQAIYGMMALGAAQALYNYMVGGEDKDGTPFFEKIAPWTRRLNSVMMLPIKDSEGRPYRMTWSLPYFFAMPHTAGAAMMQLALKAMGVAKESTGEILHNVMHSALEALTPMSQEDTLAGKFTPEPGRGILHAYLNQDFSGRSLYTNFPKAGLARSEQGKTNTGSAWKGIASFANKATGGDRYHRGFADMYPEAWKEIFGGPTSAVERLTGHVASAIDDVAHGRAPNVDDIPVARTIISGDHSYDQADTARFYKERNEASAANDAYKQARKNGDHAVANQMMKENGAQIRSAARYQAASKQVNALYKELDRVKKDDKMPAAKKDSEEQRIQKRQLEIMRGAEAH